MDEENKEIMLDSPLIVHKVTDASYQETASELDMEHTHTHTDEDSADEPTLERHRFRKENKKSKAPIVFTVIFVLAAVVLALLVSRGVIKIGPQPTTETTTTKKSYTTQAINEYEGIITVKGPYIFFEGLEISGYEELERKVKYLEKGKKFVIQDVDADSDLLNFEVLSLLSNYGIDYEITHRVTTPLKSHIEIEAERKAAEEKKKKEEESRKKEEEKKKKAEEESKKKASEEAENNG
jgi:hypothetical protein